MPSAPAAGWSFPARQAPARAPRSPSSAKTHEAIDHRRYPGSDRFPVVYVTVPPAATPRMLAVEFARFLGIPVMARASITDVIQAVCGVMTDARTTVVCVDEIYNLKLATRNGAEVAGTLKYFSGIPATFVYAGINTGMRHPRSGLTGMPPRGWSAEPVPQPCEHPWIHPEHPIWMASVAINGGPRSAQIGGEVRGPALGRSPHSVTTRDPLARTVGVFGRAAR